MCGGAEKQQLRGAQAQHFAAERVGTFERPLDQQLQNMVNLAQPAQCRGEEQSHKSPIARLEAGEIRLPRKCIVERLALVQAGHQHVERDASGDEGIFHFASAYKLGMLGAQTNWGGAFT